MSGLLRKLSSRSPAIRRTLWRAWYDLLAGRYRQREWTFMNYGYAPLTSEPPVPLAADDEANRPAIQLYRHVIGETDLRGAAVLEVGCGRGGGCSYVARCLGPASVLGVDFSPQAIQFCRKVHAAPNLSFLQGDAEALPCPSGEFDAVLNVESSHCYGSMAAFVGEVFRVLKPGGRFLWADMSPPTRLEEVRGQFRQAGFVLERETPITANVLRALDLMSDERSAMIRRLAPRPLARFMGDFAGVRGTRVYESLRSGAVEYVSCALRKPEASG